MNCWLLGGEFDSAAMTYLYILRITEISFIYILLHLLVVLNFSVASSWFINQLSAANS